MSFYSEKRPSKFVPIKQSILSLHEAQHPDGRVCRRPNCLWPLSLILTRHRPWPLSRGRLTGWPGVAAPWFPRP